MYMLFTSITDTPELLTQNEAAVFKFTSAHYREVLSSPTLHFREQLINSLSISFISAFFSVFLGALAAYAVTRLNLPGGKYLLIGTLAVSMFPQISLIGYLFKIMTRTGWINTYAALIFPCIAWTLPISLWILVSYFSRIPKELHFSAYIDGCTPWQIFIRVILPVARPGIFSAGLIAFIYTFNDFLFALILTHDHTARTIPVGIALFQGLYGETPWGNIMSAAVLSTVPVILLAIIFQKQIIQGLAKGAIKE